MKKKHDNQNVKKQTDKLKASAQELLGTFSEKVLSILTEIKTTFYLFRKDKVFSYFLIVIALVVILTLVFIFLEFDQIKGKLPESVAESGGEPHWLDVTITAIYWAVVTIGTIGYGDLSPATHEGRLVLIIIIFLSMGGVAMFSANLTSALTTKRIKEGRGIMDLSRMKNHYIICGWKKNMDDILLDILHYNQSLKAKDIIIISNVSQDSIEIFRQMNPPLMDINILRGDYFNEKMLKMANVTKAKRVIILADDSTEASMTEIDSKTVMTAMTVNSLSKTVPVCAELLDKKFDIYLKNVHVDEIVYINEYSKELITQASSNIGITKIYNELLEPETRKGMTILPIPKQYIGKSFSQLSQYFRKETETSYILIGILENIGNYLERKREAIRDAQKTPDIAKLINNLHEAREIENNYPNINPADDYIIPKSSMAILIF